MNYLELLLHPGSLESSSCEKTADCILAFPRCLWLSREVSFISQNEIVYEEPGCGDLFNCFCKNSIPFNPNPGTALTFLLNLVLIDLPAAMIACVGMPIKHVELSTNEEAYAYSKLVECLLLKEKYELKKIKLEEKLKCCQPCFQNVLEPTSYPNQKEIHWQIKINDLGRKIQECEQFLDKRM